MGIGHQVKKGPQEGGARRLGGGYVTRARRGGSAAKKDFSWARVPEKGEKGCGCLEFPLE